MEILKTPVFETRFFKMLITVASGLSYCNKLRFNKYLDAAHTCLQNNFIPLVSRSWGQAGCQKKQKPSRNSNFLDWAAIIQSELKNLQKRPNFNQKLEKNADFWWFFFQSLFNFGWKIAAQTKNCDTYLEVFRFF